ncbi:carbamoyl-phosphate synthase L chain, ATP binding domain-containing protein [Gilbertella persicaria]|uniref:carbamoyl-phosphate synthase L chain, ATP binding domain-containing protein n=1 Tax=Gilbertella persicaria TaxID=101096 RepID=UPI00222089B4|nr:carbamoyl-phosphate synthase L chain, ATP binding domain-containing protein [Gilbertella persicaria]KAI8061501.1 carbamoyl-phosphate synthase L chain, ATP binding domain-containing protein [Gilbertella persicaria]
MNKSIYKVLIANRGEIACRVIRTCKRLGIATVAIYSDSDQHALFVKMADEAYHIGPSIASESYLNGQKIIEIAQQSGADALHPGYGFLSENADFAQQVIDAGINFIGPLPDTIRTIGDKIAAKVFIAQHVPSIPLIPGYNGEDQSVERLEKEARQIEFPVLLKASAGGGGKGMRTVYDASRLKEEIEAVQGESLRAFGSDKLLIEKYFESVRHIEIQIFGDRYGHVDHINERDCSIQRRHQKIMEETPSPAMDPSLRMAMTTAAVELGRQLGYLGAGTVEFILDEKTRKFYFLELNTRLQVEHPITEAISGLDLVELQFLVAQDTHLSELHLDTIAYQGHAIEVRLCAEDPDDDFSPRTGTIQAWRPSTSITGVRFDTGVQDGSEITVFYDSMIAKIIVHAPTRSEAIRSMIAALTNTVVMGITTNQKFLIQLLKHPCFCQGMFDTHFIRLERSYLFPAFDLDQVKPSIMAALVFHWHMRHHQHTPLHHIQSGWRNVPWRHQQIDFDINGTHIHVAYDCIGHTELKAWLEASSITLRVLETHLSQPLVRLYGIQGAQGLLRCTIQASQHHFYVAEQVRDVNDKSIFVHDFSLGYPTELIKIDRFKSHTATGTEDDRVTPYMSSMPCRILKVLTPSGTMVKKNTPLLSMESMKTEIKILSRHEGVVTIHVEENQLVDARVLLCSVDKKQFI